MQSALSLATFLPVVQAAQALGGEPEPREVPANRAHVRLRRTLGVVEESLDVTELALRPADASRTNRQGSRSPDSVGFRSWQSVSAVLWTGGSALQPMHADWQSSGGRPRTAPSASRTHRGRRLVEPTRLESSSYVLCCLAATAPAGRQGPTRLVERGDRAASGTSYALCVRPARRPSSEVFPRSTFAVRCGRADASARDPSSAPSLCRSPPARPSCCRYGSLKQTIVTICGHKCSAVMRRRRLGSRRS